MRRFLGIAAVAVMVAVCFPADAASIADVQFADQVTVGDANLQLNGLGLRKKLWVKVYAAGLYVPEKSTDPAAVVAADGPKRMVMHFLTDRATKSKMDEAWIEGFEANADAFAAIEDRARKFIDLFGDMKDGDRVEMTIVPGTGTTVVINGDDKGTIEGDDFGVALLKVWLGDKPPTDDLKDGVLGR